MFSDSSEVLKFIKAENAYRHERTHRSFVEHGGQPAVPDRRGHGQLRLRRGRRSSFRGATWSSRTV